MIETDINTSEKKVDLTLDMVMRVVKLSKLQIRSVFTAILQRGFAAGADVLDDEAVFYLLLADMLENLAFLSAEQRMLLLELMRASRRPADPWMADEPTPCCIDQIAFADGRFATWTGQLGWTDLESGEQVKQLSRTPLETIAYNLIELRRRGVQIITSRAGLNGNHSAGSVEKQGDVCERPTDTVSG